MLRSTIRPALQDTNTLFTLLTSTFLSFATTPTTSPSSSITHAQNRLRASLAKLKKAERDAKLEVSYGYYEPGELKKVVGVLERMRDCLGAMARCVLAERRLLRRGSVSRGVGVSGEGMSGDGAGGEVPLSAQQLAEQINENTQRSQQAIHRLMTDFISIDVDETGSEISNGLFGGNKNLFQRFVGSVAPAMKELSATCSMAIERMGNDVEGVNRTGLQDTIRRGSTAPQVLASHSGDLHTPHNHAANSTESISPATLTHITSALKSFDTHQRTDVQKFFESDAAGTVTRPVREEFFLAFLFVFGVREFGKECRNLAEEISRLRSLSLSQSAPRFWLPSVGFFDWLSAEQEFTVEQNAASEPDLTGKGKTRGDVGKGMAFRGRMVRGVLTRVSEWVGTQEARFAIKLSGAVVLMGMPGVLDWEWFREGLAVWAVVTVCFFFCDLSFFRGLHETGGD
ncbi:hypothetical protein HK097_003370 [Rhizophlyctis rosea]|uniref:Uncharacterized protein n=1 Tax=Rhizophlyctis rosea TaxID=64517 RepID=A0AAD5S493_9FUNG|nr:hypothetical protein HK097_003370 [Rhizophlyctis rosea]